VFISFIGRFQKISIPQGSYFFELSKFHDFPWPFPWLFKVSHDLNLTIFLGNFQNFSWFRVRFTLFLTKNNLPNLFCTINTTFHDFPWPTLKFHDFPGLENEILKFHDFPGFPWPVQTLIPYHGRLPYFKPKCVIPPCPQISIIVNPPSHSDLPFFCQSLRNYL